MKSKKFYTNNIGKYTFFALTVFVIIGLFLLFILRFNNIDNNKYAVNAGSVFYDDDYNYYKSANDSYIAQKLDGNYYWYSNKDSKKSTENVGKNPVIYNKNDYKLYLYGNCYQVMSSGEVKSLSKNTEIAKASPTKFYKLKDRKYLMVDSNLKTDDKTINTRGYLIIELDKQGNATFVNNELNVKTIKPLILKGTTMSFDIAHEKLLYGKKEINVKNIIGSTNKYKDATTKKSPEPTTTISTKDKDKDSSDSSSGDGASSSVSTQYYDDYLKNVVKSVNNLTKSVTEVNTKTDNSVKKGEIYYDFSKYIALKSVTSSVSTINVGYSVVDSNNEYQSVFLKVDDNRGNNNTYYLNKNETNYTVRDLDVNRNYTVSFGYKLVTATDDVIEDVVNIKTKSPYCNLSVSKLSRNTLTYNIKIGAEYKFDYAEVHLYTNGLHVSSSSVNMDKAVSTSGYSANIGFSTLGDVNTLKLENIVYNGNNVPLDCSYRFVS